jgi:hypothetical protein
MRTNPMPILTHCTACAAAVPSGRFCAVCGAEIGGPPRAGSRESGTGEALSATRSLFEPDQADGSETPWRRPGGTATPIAAAGHTGWVGASHTSGPAESINTPPARPTSAGARLSRGAPGGGAYAVGGIAVAVAAALVLGGPEQHTVTGDLRLYDDAFYGAPAEELCTGTGGYDDIAAGSQVILEDAVGRTVATSMLLPGTSDGMSCVFPFVIADVEDSDFYRLSVGRELRGGMRISYEEMVDDNWSVHLTLGAS